MAINNFDNNSPWEEDKLESNFNEEESSFHFPWKKIFISLFIILGLIAILIGYIFYKPNPPQISIEIQKPDNILAGKSFDLKVIIHNDSDKTLSNSKLFLNLPEGVIFLEDDPNKKMSQIDIGQIESKSLHEENFKLIAFSSELTVKTINTKLTYKLIDSNISFETNSNFDLNITKSALNILVSAPEKIYNSQNFKILIKYENNSDYDFNNVVLKIDYPPIFKFIDSSPNLENNIWNIGKVSRKSSGVLEIIGQLNGPEGQSANFGTQLLTTISGKSYTLASQSYMLTISQSNLALNILLNNESNYISKIGDTLNYTFQYKNNSNIAMENVILTVKLDSKLFDFTNLQTTGYFDSLANTFIWNAANNPDFKILPPGVSGQIQLKIPLKKEFIVENQNDKNFILKVFAQIESPTVPEGIVSNRTIFATNFETKVRGFIDFQVFGLYRDPNWQILNKGPYPPKVNQPTQYSIHWKIKNYANDISNVKISGVLPPGTKFTGIYKSNIDIQPNYNSDSGLILVNIPKIPANRGVFDNPIEIVFQVENIPSLTQVGQNALLMSNIKLEANDDFTSEDVNYVASDISTELKEDQTIKIQDRRVTN
jgi:uncharacterized repeat protein (TIGR01451 family)